MCKPSDELIVCQSDLKLLVLVLLRLDALTNEEPTCGSYRKIICGRDNEPECPNRGFAVAYIVTYIIISYLIVINM